MIQGELGTPIDHSVKCVRGIFLKVMSKGMLGFSLTVTHRHCYLIRNQMFQCIFLFHIVLFDLGVKPFWDKRWQRYEHSQPVSVMSAETASQIR